MAMVGGRGVGGAGVGADPGGMGKERSPWYDGDWARVMGGGSRLLTRFFCRVDAGTRFHVFAVLKGVPRAFLSPSFLEGGRRVYGPRGSPGVALRYTYIFAPGPAAPCHLYIRTWGWCPQRIRTCHGAGRRPCLLSARHVLAHPPTTLLP